jgi:hypothetical protein
LPLAQITIEGWQDKRETYSHINDDQHVKKKGQICPAYQAMKNPDMMSYLESLIRSRLQHVRHVSLSAVPVRERMSEVTRMQLRI